MLGKYLHAAYPSVSWPTLSPQQWSAFALTLTFMALALLESRRFRVKAPRPGLRESYRANLGLFVFNSLTLSLLSSVFLLAIVPFWGLYEKFYPALPNGKAPAFKTCLDLLSLDLLLYLWHKACHRFDCLWLFHKVHHNEPALNVSTAFRIHITELALTTVLKALWIILIGIEGAAVLIHETLTTAFVMFHHANVRFQGEQTLGRLVITPALHRVHHSAERHEHDSNYGSVLSVWDRLLGTLRTAAPKKIGLKGASPLTFYGLVKFGFTASHPAPVLTAGELEEMIAEAAYYRAEKRHFIPGREMEDWLEAKNAILQEYGEPAPSSASAGVSRPGLLF